MKLSYSPAYETSELKIGFFEYTYVLMLMLYAGRSVVFFENPSITENPVGVMVPIIMSGFLALKWKTFFSAEFYMVLLYFFIYFVLVCIKYYEFRPTFLITYSFLFFTTYVAVRALGFNIFLIFERILYYFAIISLFLWGFQVAAGGDFLFNIIARFSFLFDWSFVSGEGLSTIVYSIQPYVTTIINEHTIARNCGFAWEPGSYASYLNIGIFINLFMAPDGQHRRLRFWVLLAATLSTMSTTGYVLLAVILLFFLMNKDMKKVLMMLPVVIIVLVVFFSLPFMKDKIVSLITETANIDQIVYDSYGRENPTTPQRFSSFIIALVDFRENPVLGLATHTELSWTDRIGSRISAITGIGNMMAQFGLFGIIPFIILLIRSSFLFSAHFRYRGKWLLFLIIILIAVSYTVLMLPFIMSFWMFSLFEPGYARQRIAHRKQVPATKTAI